MPQEFANIIGSHAHGFEVIGCGGTSPVGRNRPQRVSVGVPLLIDQASRFAEQRDQGIVEKL
jgi:hypothetical protein